MATFIEKEDYEFLLLSEKFCNKIDKYIELLQLDPEVIEAYKGENRLFAHVFFNKENYGGCTDSFVRVKIENMRSVFSLLELVCKCSENYSFLIGQDLGLETETYVFQLN